METEQATLPIPGGTPGDRVGDKALVPGTGEGALKAVGMEGLARLCHPISKGMASAGMRQKCNAFTDQTLIFSDRLLQNADIFGPLPIFNTLLGSNF